MKTLALFIFLRAGLAFTVLFGVVAGTPFCAQAQAGSGAREERWAADRVIVQLRDVATHGASASAPLRAVRDWVQRLGLPPGVTLRSMRNGRGPELSAADGLELDRPVVVYLHGSMPVPEAVAALQKRPEVVFAEPDYIGSGAGRPNDPNYSSQWHHQRIESEAAWDVTIGSSSVTVAVLDSGLNSFLSEFALRVRAGYDYVNNDTQPADDHGHGTAVTGVVAAHGNNNTLVAGMDWRCQILPYKVLDAQGNGFYSWWAQAIYDATDAGAKVINLSAGGHPDSAALEGAINYAISGGAIFITITHNDDSNVGRFPGRLPQCITVGATERDDTKGTFSNYGTGIDLVAPGRDIYTVGRNGGLEYWWGTSFAAPQVAGVAALVAGRDPTINQRAMEQLLTASAQDQIGGPSDTSGWDQYFGYGRLNARHALMLAGPRAPPPQPLNVSTRARVLTGDRAMIGGFIITGSHAKNTLIRAVGPSLAAAGVEGALQDPQLELRDAAGTLIASNDNWRIDAQAQDVIATGIPPADDREAALVRILPRGAYTAVVRGKGDERGVALVEAYDLQQTRNSKLANISTRGFVDFGENVMIGGFIVGAGSNYVVRAIGPSMSGAGVTDALADPTLELRDSQGNLVEENDNWNSDARAPDVQNAGLAPVDSRESAMYRNLSAGSYTAIVRGSNGATGVALVELYNVF